MQFVRGKLSLFDNYEIVKKGEFSAYKMHAVCFFLKEFCVIGLIMAP
jgi:hypothetical protein